MNAYLRVDGLSKVFEAIVIIRNIRKHVIEGEPLERFVHGEEPLFSIRRILRISKLCFEALCIISHHLRMKVECKVLPTGDCDFEDLRLWFNELTGEVDSRSNIFV